MLSPAVAYRYWAGQEIQVRSRHTLTVCGPSDGKEVTDVFGRPVAPVGVGSARLRPLAAHGVGCPAADLNVETGQLSRHYIAEILLNVTFNNNTLTYQLTFQKGSHVGIRLYSKTSKITESE